MESTIRVHGGKLLGTAKEAAGRKEAGTAKEGTLILARKEGWCCQGRKADTGKEERLVLPRKLAKEASRLMG